MCVAVISALEKVFRGTYCGGAVRRDMGMTRALSMAHAMTNKIENIVSMRFACASRLMERDSGAICCPATFFLFISFSSFCVCACVYICVPSTHVCEASKHICVQAFFFQGNAVSLDSSSPQRHLRRGTKQAGRQASR